jgi:hypothetical protein
MAVKATKEKKPKKTQYGQGISEIGNFYKDLLRGIGNFEGSVGNWFASREQPKYGIGDYVIGLGPAAKKKKTTAPKTTDTLAPAPVDEPAPTLADFLRQASSYNTNTGPDFTALQNQLRGQASDSDARIAAMYNQLRGSIDADAPGIQQNYQGAVNAIGQQSNQASDSINAAYQAARNNRMAELQALGIQDAAARPDLSGQDQARAVSNIAQNQAINQNQLSQNEASALTHNTNIGNAAGLEGNLQRANIQRQLTSRLADLQAQQSQQAGQSMSQNIGLAEALSQDYWNQQDRKNALEQATMEAANKMSPQDIITEYMKLLNQYGGDTDKAKVQLDNLLSTKKLFS